MSLYQTVKSAITVRQVGEMYGMEPDRHGMVCCPFHSDSDPSMKLNDTYYENRTQEPAMRHDK